MIFRAGAGHDCVRVSAAVTIIRCAGVFGRLVGLKSEAELKPCLLAHDLVLTPGEHMSSRAVRACVCVCGVERTIRRRRTPTQKSHGRVNAVRAVCG